MILDKPKLLDGAHLGGEVNEEIADKEENDEDKEEDDNEGKI